MTPVSTLIKSARSWLGTPYHHRARVKGVGVDCGQLVIAAHVEAGIVADFDTGFYTTDWHLHRYEDRYIEFVEDHLRRIDDSELSIDARLTENSAYGAPSGSVVVFRVGRTFSHGGIVTQWPFFIHAYQPSGIVEEVSLVGTPMSRRPIRTYIHGELLP